MSWWTVLNGWDTAVFQGVNAGMSNALFDAVLPWCRERWFWAPAYVFLVAFTVLNFGKRGWLVVLGLVLAVGIADFTSSSIIKKNVQRLRPCNEPALEKVVVERVPCGGGYSFTSSHATNHFAAAFYVIGLFGAMARWIRPAVIGWAALIAFSQVYVGVHYPLDVMAGAVLGMLIGSAVSRWMLRWDKVGILVR